jgi:hypothetical protein
MCLVLPWSTSGAIRYFCHARKIIRASLISGKITHIYRKKKRGEYPRFKKYIHSAF